MSAQSLFLFGIFVNWDMLKMNSLTSNSKEIMFGWKSDLNAK